MSEGGRKYQHTGARHPHAPVTGKGLAASTKILVAILVLALIGAGWGLATGGGALTFAAGIGEALR